MEVGVAFAVAVAVVVVVAPFALVLLARSHPLVEGVVEVVDP